MVPSLLEIFIYQKVPKNMLQKLKILNNMKMKNEQENQIKKYFRDRSEWNCKRARMHCIMRGVYKR